MLTTPNPTTTAAELFEEMERTKTEKKNASRPARWREMGKDYEIFLVEQFELPKYKLRKPCAMEVFIEEFKTKYGINNDTKFCIYDSNKYKIRDDWRNMIRKKLNAFKLTYNDPDWGKKSNSIYEPIYETIRDKMYEKRDDGLPVNMEVLHEVWVKCAEEAGIETKSLKTKSFITKGRVFCERHFSKEDAEVFSATAKTTIQQKEREYQRGVKRKRLEESPNYESSGSDNPQVFVFVVL